MYFSMEFIHGMYLPGHPDISAQVYGGALLISGRIGFSLNFMSIQKQHAIINIPYDTCAGNVDLCDQGLTMAFWLYMKSQEKYPISLFYSGMLHFIPSLGTLNVV